MEVSASKLVMKPEREKIIHNGMECEIISFDDKGMTLKLPDGNMPNTIYVKEKRKSNTRVKIQKGNDGWSELEKMSYR